MGGRGGSSGMSATGASPYRDYYNIEDANAALGFGNGGEADQWTKGLSAEEKRAINDYSRAGFKSINGALRKLKDGKDVDPDSSVGKRANAIEGAIDRYNLSQPTTFHRVGNITSIITDRKTLTDMMKYDTDSPHVAQVLQSKVGQVIHDKGFTSTSASRDKTRSTGITDNIRYHIKTPSGKGIGAYIPGASHYKTDESEFLFNRGSAFKITGVTSERVTRHTITGSYGDVIYHINMEYVGRSR